MLNSKTIAVVVKAYNEEKQIHLVFDNMPDYVDRIVVINDGSKDRTAEVVKQYIRSDSCEAITISKDEIANTAKVVEGYNRADVILAELRAKEDRNYPKHEVYNDNDSDRIVLINSENSGPGGAVSLGYKWCREHHIDCSVVIDGDGQMDLSEMRLLVLPVIDDNVDYVKGNRLSHPATKIVMPQIRFFGSKVLTLMTKIASGYWSVSDPQTGFTAISYNALNRLPIDKIYRSYGYPNDILIKLNIARCKIAERPIKPVYQIGDQSKMKIARVIPRLSWLLLKGFLKRLWSRYFVDSFHPLFLMYVAGIIMGIINLPITCKIIYDVLIRNGHVSIGWYITFMLLALFSFQSICFGMWMDMQDNIKLEED